MALRICAPLEVESSFPLGDGLGLASGHGSGGLKNRDGV
jgi:hypothetical protein